MRKNPKRWLPELQKLLSRPDKPQHAYTARLLADALSLDEKQPSLEKVIWPPTLPVMAAEIQSSLLLENPTWSMVVELYQKCAPYKNAVRKFHNMDAKEIRQLFLPILLCSILGNFGPDSQPVKHPLTIAQRRRLYKVFGDPAAVKTKSEQRLIDRLFEDSTSARVCLYAMREYMIHMSERVPVLLFYMDLVVDYPKHKQVVLDTVYKLREQWAQNFDRLFSGEPEEQDAAWATLTQIVTKVHNTWLANKFGKPRDRMFDILNLTRAKAPPTLKWATDLGLTPVMLSDGSEVEVLQNDEKQKHKRQKQMDKQEMQQENEEDLLADVDDEFGLAQFNPDVLARDGAADLLDATHARPEAKKNTVERSNAHLEGKSPAEMKGAKITVTWMMISTEHSAALWDFIQRLDHRMQYDDAFVRILEALPAFGVSRRAVGTMLKYTKECGLDNPHRTMVKWTELLSGFSQQHGLLFCLVHAANSMWRRYSSNTRMLLPRNYYDAQVRALQRAAGICTNTSILGLRSSLFYRCSVCNEPISAVRRFNSSRRFCPSSGFNDPFVDYKNDAMYCPFGRTVMHMECGDKPVVAEDNLGVALQIGGVTYVRCVECGVTSEVDVTRCVMTENGPLCCEHTIEFRIKQLDSTFPRWVPPRFKCHLCPSQKESATGLGMFFYGWNTFLCTRHNPANTVRDLENLLAERLALQDKYDREGPPKEETQEEKRLRLIRWDSEMLLKTFDPSISNHPLQMLLVRLHRLRKPDVKTVRARNAKISAAQRRASSQRA